jgi:hypothetical protein
LSQFQMSRCSGENIKLRVVFPKSCAGVGGARIARRFVAIPPVSFDHVFLAIPLISTCPAI